MIHSAKEFTLITSQGLHQNIDALYKGLSIGIIKFDYSSVDKVLRVHYLNVDQDFRRNKISKLLLAKALAAHPETLVIKSSLTETNEEVYNAKKRELADGKRWPTYEDGLLAVMQTPAYLLRASLGFSKIIYYEQEHYSVSLHVAKEDFATEEP